MAVGLDPARRGHSGTPAVAIQFFRFQRFNDDDYLAETLPKVVRESGIKERVHG